MGLWAVITSYSIHYTKLYEGGQGADSRRKRADGQEKETVRVGLSYNVKPADHPPHLPADAFEEFDSEATVDHLYHALSSLGHEVLRLGAGSGIIDALREMRPDFVFNIAEGEGGRCREAHVPALLEMLNIPYLGLDPLTLCVTLDKAVAKRLVSPEA